MVVEQRTTVATLLQELLEVSSVTGHEAPAVQFLCKQLAALGYESWIDGAGNAVGRRGSGPLDIVLLGHIDTVAGLIPVQRDGDILFGRGAVDAKGPLAAFVAAGAEAALPPGVSLTVIGAVGEESQGSPGATWLTTNYPTPAAVVIGEPSGWDGLVLGYKGSLGMTASITTEVSHSAGPEQSAAEIAFDLWYRITTFADAQAPADAGVFERITPSLRSMNTSSDGISDSATLQATFRIPPGITLEGLQAQLAEIVGDAATSWQPNAPAIKVDKRSPLVAPFLGAIRAAGGTPRLKVKTGTSDMNIVGPVWGCPIVSYGPGDSSFDHRPDEQISISELERGTEILLHALNTIAQRLGATA